MMKLLHFLNPIEHLGDRKDANILFSFLTTIAFAAVLEFYAYGILADPDGIGLYAIFIFIALIIYFSFREGRRGGFIATAITIAYYFYIINTRQYEGARRSNGIETTIALGILYAILAWVIGWLKETIDSLIEREANEKQWLQTVIQQLPVGVIIVDDKHRIARANHRINDILGKEVPLGLKIDNSLFIKSKQNGKTIAPTDSPLYQALTTGKTIIEQEVTITKNKRDIYLHVNAAPIHNRDGNIIAAASIISDITTQKELEQRKDDFVNMASHELKTPLTSINLYIDLLQRQVQSYKDDRAFKTLNNIKGQISRLQKLVSDLLDVSRLQTGKLSFKTEVFRIDQLIQETVEVLQESTKKQQIICKKQAALSVCADRFRVYQVITNLITNAIKYSPEETDIIINIYPKGKQAVVSITDSGIGIAKSEQKKIFERLYQVVDDAEKTFPGFGMGLYISKEIIERHKGSIWVESEKNKGSTFYFSLPVHTQ